MFFYARFSFKKLLSICVVHRHKDVNEDTKENCAIIQVSMLINKHRKKVGESILELTARKDNTQSCFAFVCKHFTKQIYLSS